MAGNQGNNKIQWQSWQVNYLQANHAHYTAQQLADAVGESRTITRNKLYSMGLRKMELQKWSVAQVEFLRANYENMGDTELSQLFAQKWQKEKGWSKKHIEKKRRQLGLTHTPEQLRKIKDNHIANGVYTRSLAKRWQNGQAENGTLRQWGTVDSPIQMIKINGKWKSHARTLWQSHYGPIPPGQVVRIIDGNPNKVNIENLTLVTRAQNAVLNRRSEISESRKIIKQLHKKITQHEQQTKRP